MKDNTTEQEFYSTIEHENALNDFFNLNNMCN